MLIVHDLRALMCIVLVLKLQNHSTNGNFSMSLVFARISNLMEAVRQIDTVYWFYI